MPSVSQNKVSNILKEINKIEGLSVKILPNVDNLIEEGNLATQLRNIKLEDLLGREEIKINTKEKCVMKYMVVGANGQLGQELVHLLNERNAIYVAFDSKSLDITDRDLVFKTLESERPDVLLDAAAYTAVDAAEDEGKDLNWRVNAEGTKNLADAAKTFNAKLIYVSTDYVFDGGKVGPYLETDDTNPQNEYGKAKLAGEKYVIKKYDI